MRADQLFRQADEELQALIANHDADTASTSALAAICRHWGDTLIAADRSDEAAKQFTRSKDLWPICRTKSICASASCGCF